MGSTVAAQLPRSFSVSSEREAGLGCVGEQRQAGVGREVESVVGQAEVADDGMAEVLTPALKKWTLGRGPAGAKRPGFALRVRRRGLRVRGWGGPDGQRSAGWRPTRSRRGPPQPRTLSLVGELATQSEAFAAAGHRASAWFPPSRRRRPPPDLRPDSTWPPLTLFHLHRRAPPLRRDSQASRQLGSHRRPRRSDARDRPEAEAHRETRCALALVGRARRFGGVDGGRPAAEEFQCLF